MILGLGLGLAAAGCATEAPSDTDSLEQASAVPTVIASGEEFPSFVIVDATRAYWFNLSEPIVLRETLKGGGGTPSTFADGLASVGVPDQDATHVYWPWGEITPNTGGIQKRAKAGGEVESVIKGVRVWDILVEGSTIYFVSPDDNGYLASVPVTGGAITKIATNLGEGLDTTPTLAISGNRIAWTQWPFDKVCEGRVRYVLKTGGPVHTVQDNICGVYGLAADATSVIWTEYDETTNVGRLIRHKLGFTPGIVQTVLDTSAGQAKHVLVHPNTPDHVFWFGVHNGVEELRKVPKLVGTKTTIAKEPELTFWAAIDEGHLYWTTPLTGEVKRIAR